MDKLKNALRALYEIFLKILQEQKSINLFLPHVKIISKLFY